MITAVQNQDLYIIRFQYDPELVRLVKNVPGRRYDPDQKYWTIPVDRLGFFMVQLQGTQYESQLKVYSAEHIDENASLDATSRIPDIDLTGIPMYVQDGHSLFQHQLDFMKYAIDRQRRGLYSGFILADQMGAGKALSLDTKIYTPDGYKLMRDIKVGDYVFGRDGKPTKVRAVYDHHEVEMYRITFSDGVAINCCKDHLWEIHDQQGLKIVPTSWFLQKDQFGKVRKNHLRTKTNYKYWIRRCDPVEFNYQNIPLDPYLLGILLGDGGITHGVSLSTADPEIVEYVRSMLPDGYTLKRRIHDDYSYNISTGCPGKSNIFINILRELNLFGKGSHTKFVPDVYKYNSIEVRTAILQGLLDTDGYCGHTNFLQYTTVSKQLADDVQFLVESLGGLATVSSKLCGYRVHGEYKFTSIAYTITIKFDNPQDYVRLNRRKQILSPRKFHPHRNIINIERIDNSDARCISVDNAEHLYLIDHFVVTHNTLEVTNLALYNRKFNHVKHCLIIACVNSAKYNWIEDIKKHTNGQEVPYLLGARKKRDGTIRMDGSSLEKLEDLLCGHMYGDKEEPALPFFLIMNIEAIRMRSNRRYPIRERLTTLINKKYIGMIAIDECHTGLSPSSLQGKQILKLKKDIQVAVEWIPMTGTPIVNKPTDVFVPLKLVDGHAYSKYYDWCQNFCVYGGFGNHQIIAYKNIPNLKKMLQANMLRRLKSDILDLPPKIRTIDYVENTPYQEKLYTELVTNMLSHRTEIISSLDPRTKFLKLRQVNGSPEIVDTTLSIDKFYLSKNAKMIRLIDLVNTIIDSGEKVVIFSNWVESLRTIYKFLAKDHKVCCYTGTMKPEDREQHKQRFQNDPEYKILIGTVGALGTSHTLTAANNVIFYDLPWNPATVEQAEDRCHRAGTSKTVNIYYIITKNSVDERVYDLILQKDGVSKYIVDNELSIKDNPQLFDFLLGHDPNIKL